MRIKPFPLATAMMVMACAVGMGRSATAADSAAPNGAAGGALAGRAALGYTVK